MIKADFMCQKVLRNIAMMVLLLCSTLVVAQTTIKGKVVDVENGEPLVGATIKIEGTDLGTITDQEGMFTISSRIPMPVLKLSYLGYKDNFVKVSKTGETDLGNIVLKVDAMELNDVIIMQSIATARKTPVALSTLDPLSIEEKIGTQEFPEVLKETPSVYATKNGGGFGDSKINMRGFKQENIAVMVNGIPMNDMEWGGLYWSNWAGLADVTRSMQTQRGLGASKVSAPSVGGSINIVTRTIDQQRGGFASYGFGNDKMNNFLVSLSTGMNEDGWAFSIMGGHRWGDGYVQGTEFDGYNYFINIAKKITAEHTLSFTAFGAPQNHYQRSSYDGLTIKGWQEVENYMKGESPYKYNATYGFGKNGERKTSTYNSYHKPQISLNHQWQIDYKSSLSTAFYVSLGRGYGYEGVGTTSAYKNAWYGASNGILNMTFRNADGTYAYDQIQDMNETSENGSSMVMTKAKNNHDWYGLLSTYTTHIGKNIDFYGGVDMRYYKGTHTNEIVDLYNGSYYCDTYYRQNVLADNNMSALNPQWKYQKLGVGDVVYRNYDGFVVQEGAFAQAEYTKDKLSAFISGSLSNSSYWRKDRFYYDKEHEKSSTENFVGFTFKGGANYNFDKNHNIFANIGYISRAPFYSNVFLSYRTSNETNSDAVNEKVFSAELGYGYRSEFLFINVNAYYTKWMDKSMAAVNELSVVDTNGEVGLDRCTINMQGVNAVHKGIEFDWAIRPYKWLDITGMLSVGNWKWDSDATGYYYSSNGQLLGAKDLDKDAYVIGGSDPQKAVVKMNGVKVGGSAQTTLSSGVKFRLDKGLFMGLNYNLYSRMYADFFPSSSDLNVGSTKTYTTPWRVPTGQQFDFYANYSFRIGSCDAVIFGNINNVFDNEYIVDAYNGDDSTWQSAYRVFYAFGRTYSVKMKVSF